MNSGSSTRRSLMYLSISLVSPHDRSLRANTADLAPYFRPFSPFSPFSRFNLLEILDHFLPKTLPKLLTIMRTRWSNQALCTALVTLLRWRIDRFACFTSTIFNSKISNRLSSVSLGNLHNPCLDSLFSFTVRHFPARCLIIHSSDAALKAPRQLSSTFSEADFIL